MSHTLPLSFRDNVRKRTLFRRDPGTDNVWVTEKLHLIQGRQKRDRKRKQCPRINFRVTVYPALDAVGLLQSRMIRVYVKNPQFVARSRGKVDVHAPILPYLGTGVNL